ncbi:MAG: EAL domain-containing protein [Rugosibacter sp.]|nr:EAL domain-containing protein [Rugosibacter sp.]
MIDVLLESKEDPPSNPISARILVIDDDLRLNESLKLLLKLRGYDPQSCTTGTEALRMLNQESFDVILLDLDLPDISGHDVANHVLQGGAATPIIVISGDNSIDSAIQALRNGVTDFVKKPYQPEHLLKTIANTIYRRHLEKTNRLINNKLEHSKNLYRYLIDSSPDIIYTVDQAGCFTFVNDQIESLGFRKEELIGQHYSFLIHEDDIDRAKFVFNERRKDSRTKHNIELRLKCRSTITQFRHFETRFATIVLKSRGLYSSTGAGESESFLGTYGVARDISDRKRIEEAINHQAYHDALTGLPNRALFKDRLGLMITMSQREELQCATLFIDLDRFKWVNDTLGHMHGDELLKMVATRLKNCLRKGDTLARLGGDEFTVLLPNIKGRENAQNIAEKMLMEINRSFTLGEQEVFISASIGIAMYPDDGATIEALLKCADIAMYHVKWEGKNGVLFYNPGMNVIFHRKLSMENDLRRAIECGDQFVLNYQPQVDIENHRIVGMETLVRWNHPERGLIAPGEFIPLAEETGLITQLTEWVYGQACRDLAMWQKAGFTDLRMAINISPKDIGRRDFVDFIKRGLRDHKLSGDKLEIEITEGIIMGDRENAISKFKELSALGVEISIDDFGTGYSSLGYLKEFPIHTIKIDKSFVHGISGINDKHPIISAITALAHGLQVGLIAEGVESLEHMQVLQAVGCKVMQGFLFSRPVCNEEALTLLARPEILFCRVIAIA